jgi:phage regulator Rha-like protein
MLCINGFTGKNIPDIAFIENWFFLDKKMKAITKRLWLSKRLISFF